MFKRRDIPPVLLLLLLIILVMLTLSQILVVHNGRYGRNVHNMRKLQLELREMDINLHSLMMQNVPSIELNRRLLQNEINAGRIAAIIAQASRTQRALPDRGRTHPGVPGTTRRGGNKSEWELGMLLPPPVAVVSPVSGRGVLDDRLRTRPPVLKVAAGPGKVPPNGVRSNVSLVIKTHDTGQQQQQQHTRHISFSHTASTRQNSSTSTPSRTSSPSRMLGDNTSHRDDTTLTSHTSTAPSSSTSSFPHTGHQRGASTFTNYVNFPSHGVSTSGGHLQTKVRDDGQRHSAPGAEYGMVSRTSLSDNSYNIMNNYNSNNNVIGGKYGVIHLEMARGKKKDRINYCPSIPPSLKGRVFVNFEHRHNFTESEIVRHNPHIQPGGMWRPTACVARHRVAIIVPYRDRWEHLMILLSHLHPILERQQLDYRIFVVEQAGKDTFNKARIMNIAFVEALKQNNFQCFVFHDVDLVPEDDRNMYSCPTQPRHMSVAIDEMGYKLAYQELVGGVLNMRTEHFQRVNGYSNLYWGWGAEDDDMAYRIMHVGLKITRPPEGVARYKMVKHTKRKPADWRKRAKLLYTGTRRFQFDGLNSLQYRVIHIKKLPLFTHILVDIGKPPRGF